MRTLRGERYAEGVSDKVIDFILNKLPYYDYEAATLWYQTWVPQFSPTELALLGCNDRFFLLTGLCHRVDAQHPWVYERCREVEAEPDGYLDLWSRFHYKSTVISFAGIIQEVLCNPEIRVCIFSNNIGISRPFLQQIKEEFESNADLLRLYPDVLWEKPRRDAKSWSVAGGITVKRQGNTKECTVEAHGLINALPTGRHFPLLVYDDVINERNVSSPEQIAKATERTELSFPCGDGEATRRWFIGTRYHFGDSYGYLIQKGIATPRIYAATENGKLDGDPVFMTPEAWAKTKRDMGTQVSAQMLQNPLAGDQNTFETPWLKPYWVVPTLLNVYIMCDPSRGKSKTSDRTAMSVIGIDGTGNKYLLDGYCHRMRLSERWEKLEGLHRKWSNAPGVHLVKVGYERYGAQTDDDYFEEKMLETPNARFTIDELNWTGDARGESKTHRVERLEPDFRHGEFFVPGLVWYPDVAGSEDTPDSRVARWSVDDGSHEIVFSPHRGPHQLERAARANGELWRIVEPLRRLDENKKIYDLTQVFFEEYATFPFAPRKDLIDATSRIYDMEPSTPVPMQRLKVEDYPDS
jgi:hypothetical protein